MPHPLCLIVYPIPEGFLPQIKSHGNSKSEMPFYPTLPTTMIKIKNECVTRGPKEVMKKVSMRVGGVMVEPGKIPRNEKQIQNMRRKCGIQSSEDHMYSIMLEAHTQDPSHCFVRDIKTAPEPAIILATNQQLDDIERFCTSSYASSILTINPTFTLGDFDVTVVTYRHIFLETRRGSNHPIMLGPLMIHYKKSFTSLFVFCIIFSWNVSKTPDGSSIWY